MRNESSLLIPLFKYSDRIPIEEVRSTAYKISLDEDFEQFENIISDYPEGSSTEKGTPVSLQISNTMVCYKVGKKFRPKIEKIPTLW